MPGVVDRSDNRHRTARRAAATIAGALVLFTLVSRPGMGQVTTDSPASLLFFPKVLANGAAETLIQITNTGNSTTHALCVYLDGALLFPGFPEGPLNPQRQVQTNFNISLPANQPTYWVASQGRRVDPTDPPCMPGTPDCPGAGSDPGLVPPVPPGFAGTLLCVETDPSGSPLSGNHLIGSATLTGVAPEQFSQYNAVGLRGLPDFNDGDGVLCLGGDSRDPCPAGAEYEACPAGWNWDHPAQNADDPLAGSTAPANVELTVLPCNLDLLLLQATEVILNFFVVNEFELTYSTSTPVTYWSTVSLADLGGIFDVGVLGTNFANTRVTSSGGAGILLVAEEIRVISATESSTSVSANIHQNTDALGVAEIVLPPVQ